MAGKRRRNRADRGADWWDLFEVLHLGSDAIIWLFRGIGYVVSALFRALD